MQERNLHLQILLHKRKTSLSWPFLNEPPPTVLLYDASFIELFSLYGGQVSSS